MLGSSSLWAPLEQREFDVHEWPGSGRKLIGDWFLRPAPSAYERNLMLLQGLCRLHGHRSVWIVPRPIRFASLVMTKVESSRNAIASPPRVSTPINEQGGRRTMASRPSSPGRKKKTSMYVRIATRRPSGRMAAPVANRAREGIGLIGSVCKRSAVVTPFSLHAARVTRYRRIAPLHPLDTRYTAVSRGET